MIYRTQVEAQVYEISVAPLEDMGFEIVRVRVVSMGKDRTIQLMIERMDGAGITSGDCEKVSRYIAVLLKVESAIGKDYALEISSAGLEYPLTRHKDFEKSIGSVIKVTTKLPLEGQKKFTGQLMRFQDGKVALALLNLNKEVIIEVDNIFEAQLDYFASNIGIKRR